MNKDIFKDLSDKFYDLSEDEQKSVLDTILKVANENPKDFNKFVESLDFDIGSPLAIIYKSLSTDLQNWGAFFVKELERLLALAEKTENPKRILSFINEFAFLDPNKFDERKKLIELAIKKLDHQLPLFRLRALTLLFDMKIENDRTYDTYLLKGLEDPDWIIRYWTHLECKDFNMLPEGYSLSFIDRLKSKFLDTLKYG
jgi:hypothetical protein